MLPRLRRPGDGDCGICFEYAVHDAVRRQDPMVLERVDDALSRLCSIAGSEVDSILFAVEKSGSEQLIDTASDLVTIQSQIMSGTRGRPAKLQKHIRGIAQAFRRPSAREALPYSISGLWKADLFIGRTEYRALGRHDSQVEPVEPGGRARAAARDRARQPHRDR